MSQTHQLPEGWTLNTPDDYTPVPLVKRDEWIEALASGRYLQGTGNLCYEGKYCCLGVLCDIHPDVVKRQGPRSVVFDRNRVSLPERLIGGDAFYDGLGSLPRDCKFISPRRIELFCLSSANDSGASFATIATAIRILYTNREVLYENKD